MHLLLSVTNISTYAESDSLLCELSILAKRQFDALQRSSYPKMSDASRSAFDKRGARILELRDLMKRPRKPA